MNSKICDWCHKEIEEEEEFLVSKNWEFLHVECANQLSDITNQNKNLQSDEKINGV